MSRQAPRSASAATRRLSLLLQLLPLSKPLSTPSVSSSRNTRAVHSNRRRRSSSSQSSSTPTCAAFGRLRAAAGKPDRLSYARHLATSLAPPQPAAAAAAAAAPSGAPLPANVRPSLLQRKVKQGGHDLAAVLLAEGPAAAAAPALPPGAEGRRQPQPPGVLQFTFELLRATHAGASGLAGRRRPLRRLARVAILDRARCRFLGNAHEMPAAGGASGSGGGSLMSSSTREGTWAWRADAGGAAVVRCALEQPDAVAGARALDEARLVLLVELNATFALAAEDAATLPARGDQVRNFVWLHMQSLGTSLARPYISSTHHTTPPAPSTPTRPPASSTR